MDKCGYSEEGRYDTNDKDLERHDESVFRTRDQRECLESSCAGFF